MQQEFIPQQVKLRSTMMGLTYNLDVYISAVRHALNLNGQRVLPGVGPLCGADEEDGIHFTGTNSHCFVLQRKAIFGPGHNRARLTLQVRVMKGNQNVFFTFLPTLYYSYLDLSIISLGITVLLVSTGLEVAYKTCSGLTKAS